MAIEGVSAVRVMAVVEPLTVMVRVSRLWERVRAGRVARVIAKQASIINIAAKVQRITTV